MTRSLSLLFVWVLPLAAIQLPALATNVNSTTIHQVTPAPDWQRVDTGPFSVALPPGWTYEPQQGIDSFVGDFVGPDMRLHFDYGWYWNTRPGDGAPGYEVLHEDIDFRPADLWVARADPAEVTGLYVDYVTDSEPGWPPDRLSLLGLRLAPAQQDLALAIMRSVRFRRVLPAQGRWELVAELPETSLMDLAVLDKDSVRVSGGFYGAGTPQPIGVVYELRAGQWQRRLVPGTKLVGGLDGEWAVEYGGKAALRLDVDGEWRSVLSDAPGTLFDLEDLGQAVWAVGIGALLHFDGAKWTSELGLQGGMSIDLVSKDEGWVAGARNLIRRTGSVDGGAWQAVPWPGPEGSSILAVDTISPREAWFAGGLDTTGTGGLLRQRDDGWQYHADLAPHNLWAVDLASPAEGWAVGGAISGRDPCEIVRYHEGAWQAQADVCIGFLHAVQVAADGTTWAAGYRRTAEGVFTGLVLRHGAAGVTPTVTTTPAATDTATPVPATATPSLVQPRLFVPMARKKG